MHSSKHACTHMHTHRHRQKDKQSERERKRDRERELRFDVIYSAVEKVFENLNTFKFLSIL